MEGESEFDLKFMFKQMKYSRNSIIRTNGKYTIYGNVKNGKWIRVSNALHNKFEQLLNEGEFNSICKDQKVNRLREILIDIEVLVEKEEEETLKAVTFAITNKCNLNCIHCGYSASIEENDELDKEIIMFTIQQIKDIENIGITGGEPLIHKDFYEIAEFIGKNVSGQKTLMTNATLINEKNVDCIIRNFNNIAISLDAAFEKTCDKMRGCGVFTKVISAIKLLKSKGYKNISLSFTECEINKGEEDAFYKLCEQLGVEPVVRNFFSVGRGLENKSRLVRNKKMEERIYDKKIPKSEYRKKLRLATKCGAVITSLYIHFDGGIYPCPVAGINKDLEMGNIKEIQDMNDFILKRHNQIGYKNYTKLSYEKLGRCSDCEVKDFCWKCLQEYYEFFEDNNTKSEVCSFRKKNLMEIVWGD